MKSIGILGGSGPLATAEFYTRLVRKIGEVRRCVQDTDYPNITVLNYPVEYCDCTGVTEKFTGIQSHLVEGMNKLVATGAELLVMYCNSLHIYEYAFGKIKVPFISMVGTAVEEAKNRGYKKVGVLASESTRQRRFAPR
jgi:aspartate racemase